MANYKKGLALVLAAATAFTFAPVSTLGTPVVANAAVVNQIVKDTATSVSLVKGDTKTFTIDAVKGMADGWKATATIKDKTIAQFTTAASVTGSSVGVNMTTINADRDTVSGLDADDTVTVTALAEGATTLTFVIKDTNNEIVAQQDVTLNVSKLKEVLSADKTSLSATKKANNTFVAASDDVTVTANHVTIPGGATRELVAKSSDEKVATVAKKTGTGTVTTSGNATVYTVTYKGVGTATITFDEVETSASGSKRTVATATTTVTVSDSTDTLSVKYDSNRDGVDEEYKATVETQTPTVKNLIPEDSTTVGANEYKATKPIYLDTVSNKTAKITASDAVGRTINFSSDSDAFAVDNSGNITLATDATRVTNGRRGTVTVSVAQKTVNNIPVSALYVKIPVYVMNKDQVALEVKDSDGTTIAKTVGSTNDTGSESDLPVVYMSTQDKTTDTLAFNSNVATGFIAGEVTATYGAHVESDVLTYSNGTLTAKKAGAAYVTVTARNSADTYGEAKVTFKVVVVTKKANNTITAPATINLTKAKNTATIEAKATYGNTLKYEFVKAVNSTEAATSNDVTLDAATGKLTYTSANTGSVVVRISGSENAEALAPKAAYVTVKYDSTKSANALAVANASLSLKPGETATIGATASEGSTISYVSSDDTVATVAADGTVTAVKAGAAFITVKAAETDDVLGAEIMVPVIISAADVTPVAVKKPAQVKSVKIKNVKGAKVKVSFAKAARAKGYKVVYTVGKKTVTKTTTKTSIVLSVKKGAKVIVKVRAYNKTAAGKTQYGKYSAKKSLNTDKK